MSDGGSDVRSPNEMPSVLFVCVGNTCRSVVAEWLARRRFGDSVRVASAGIRPQRPEDARDAIDTLRRLFNLDASGHAPRDVADVDLESFAVVVSFEATIEAGVAVGRHTHPGIESAYVLEGGFELPIQGQPTRTIKAGDCPSPKLRPPTKRLISRL